MVLYYTSLLFSSFPVLTLLTFKIGVANFANFAFWKTPTLLTLFLEQIANSNFANFGSGKL